MWGVYGACLVLVCVGRGVGRVWGACGGCAGRGGEKVSPAALSSGYLGKSGHLPRLQISLILIEHDITYTLNFFHSTFISPTFFDILQSIRCLLTELSGLSLICECECQML